MTTGGRSPHMLLPTGDRTPAAALGLPPRRGPQGAGAATRILIAYSRMRHHARAHAHAHVTPLSAGPHRDRLRQPLRRALLHLDAQAAAAARVLRGNDLVQSRAVGGGGRWHAVRAPRRRRHARRGRRGLPYRPRTSARVRAPLAAAAYAAQAGGAGARSKLRPSGAVRGVSQRPQRGPASIRDPGFQRS